jgi:hypothetical protein
MSRRLDGGFNKAAIRHVETGCAEAPACPAPEQREVEG